MIYVSVTSGTGFSEVTPRYFVTLSAAENFNVL